MARVLYVEDHADTREAVARMLELTGYEVDLATTGREALMLAIDKTPDVMLLDLSLPEMNGAQLVEVLRSYHRLATIPVVVLSAMHTGELAEKTRLLNVSSYLIKNLSTFQNIHAALQAALTHGRSDTRTQSHEKWRSDRISPL
jgi:two-component system KDP operon response regulator KdpE